MRFHYDYGVLLFILCAGLGTDRAFAAAQGDPATGRQLYRACAPCHSVVPGRHLTGPSLAGIWGRKAGTVEAFKRYSSALKEADVTWNEASLDAWLANPAAFIPGNRMTFRGLRDEAQRRDIAAFLRQVAEQQRPPRDRRAQGMSEGMTGGGMADQARPLDLKSLESNNRVVSIRYCGDTYTVVTENGEAHDFWEFNLRFKTDGSDAGPEPNRPVIIPGGMMGDRAFLVFASPAEISPFVHRRC